MSDLITRIKEAQQKVAKISLKEQIKTISSLEDLFSQQHSIEGIATKHKGSWVYILPVPNDYQGSLGNDLSDGVEFKLKELYGEVERGEFLGNVGYKFKNNKKGRINRTHSIDTGLGITFMVDFQQVPDLHLEDNNGIIEPMTVLSSPYQPDVHIGFTFDLNLNPTSHQYNYMPVKKDNRKFFPGFKIPFQLEFDDQNIETAIVSSVNKNPVIGSLDGSYFSRNVNKIYQAHPELVETKKMTIEVITPGEIYRAVSFGN